MITNKLLWERINKYDFGDQYLDTIPFKQKLQNSIIGLTSEEADKLILEYKKFMYIRIVYGTAAPSHLIDLVWHQHILYTKEYHDFCLMFNKGFIHHEPDRIKNSSSGLYGSTLGHYCYEFSNYAEFDYWVGADRFRILNIEKYSLIQNPVTITTICKILFKLIKIKIKSLWNIRL